MTRILGAVAMAPRITASTTGSGNRPGAKIFQLRDLLQNSGAFFFQIGERLGHRPSTNGAYHIRSVGGVEKEPGKFFTIMSRTLNQPVRDKDWMYNNCGNLGL